MLNLNEKGVDLFIKRFAGGEQRSFWESYDLIIWKKNAGGFTSVKGMFINEWGVAEKISVTNEGTWILPKKYVKYFK